LVNFQALVAEPLLSVAGGLASRIKMLGLYQKNHPKKVLSSSYIFFCGCPCQAFISLRQRCAIVHWSRTAIQWFSFI